MPPHRLYRYASLQDERLEWVKSTLLSRRIYFADPTAFNDPFECRFSFSVQGTPEQWEAFLNRPDLWASHHLVPGEVPTHAQKAEWRANLEQNAGPLAAQYRANLRHDVGVLCFSERDDDILLWSHYAESHKGIVLGIDPSVDPLISSELEQVQYRDEFPVLRYLASDPDTWAITAMATKSSHWAYEREWRVFRIPAGPGLHTLAPGTVTDVVLGSEIRPDHASQLLAWCNASEDHPTVWQVRRVPDRYSLEVVRYPSTD